jgi:ABC-type glycerol-3-phosphate transport system permease component
MRRWLEEREDYLMKPRSVAVNVALYGLLILLAVYTILPFVWMVSTSFKPMEEVFARPPKLYSPNMSFNSYRYVMEVGALRALSNTALVATAATASSLFFCTLGGYGFAKFRFPGQKALFGFLLATLVIPGAIMLVPTYVIMVKLGWTNTYLPLIVPGAANAFGIFFMRQYIGTVSDEIIDAARIDGASEFGIFWRIIAPICVPGLITLGLIFFMNSWNNYLLPSIYLKKAELYTLPLLQMQMSGVSGQTNYHNWMALATISIVPPLIIFLLFQRRFTEGITAGALAGE